jgi:superfamily II DNA or RNA helicase
MIKIQLALMRIGEPTLQALVGHEVVQHLTLLHDVVTADKLADILLMRHGADLFIKRDIRLAIFDSLPFDQAKELADCMTTPSLADPYARLAALACRPGSDTLHQLCEFFSVSLDVVLDEDQDDACEDLETVHPAYPVFDYQAQTIKRAYAYLGDKERRVLIHMPTGAGKTRAAMVLICRYLNEYPERAAVVWLAHSEELCDQAAQEFGKAWAALGTRKLKLGRFYGAHELDMGDFKDGLIVAGLSKLYSRSLGEQERFLRLMRNVGLVVMDEAHQGVAPTYQHLLDMLAPQRGPVALLGLSATPGRSWLDITQDEKLAALFSRNKVTLATDGLADPITFLQDRGYLAVPEYRWIPYQPTLQLTDREKWELANGLDLSARTLKQLGDDVQRNLLVIHAIGEQVEQGKKLIVFACSVDQAHLLAEVLSVRGVRAAAISSRTDPGERRRVLEEYKAGKNYDVLVNYGVLTTGFDAPKTNVVIVARPTQSVVLYSQMIGRAMRGPRSGGNTDCLVITVKDAIPGFRSVYEGFTHWEDVWN